MAVIAELPGCGVVDIVADGVLLRSTSGKAVMLTREAAILTRALDQEMAEAWQLLQRRLLYGQREAVVPADAQALLAHYDNATGRMARAARAGLVALALGYDAETVSAHVLGSLEHHCLVESRWSGQPCSGRSGR